MPLLRVPDNSPLLESLEGVLVSAPSGDFLVLLGDFNAHISGDSNTWSGVIAKDGLPDLKPCGVLLLDFFARCRLSVTPCSGIRASICAVVNRKPYATVR